ncbi:MAG: DUF378 domain-containing protein [Clostridia bacterium]|nr:DUF378 domain-containing protein [Clostridia bacterium]MBQ3869625.1 DUF378 domain-containing protein [Clostridia bacterium]
MVDKTALTLAIIGALNWGGVGIFGFDTVAWIFGGQGSIGARIIYTLVALAGIWCVSILFRTWYESEREREELSAYDNQTR